MTIIASPNLNRDVSETKVCINDNIYIILNSSISYCD